VIYAFGHHHLGLTLGPITGRIVADLVCNRPQRFDLTPYRINRFRLIGF
jgi:D-amino-acid dehydrogenase